MSRRSSLFESMKDQCDFLKTTRLKKELTQIEVAKMIGIPQSRYSNYENGNSSIPFSILNNFCESLHVKNPIDSLSEVSKYDTYFESKIMDHDFNRLKKIICSVDDIETRRKYLTDFMKLILDLENRIKKEIDANSKS